MSLSFAYEAGRGRGVARHTSSGSNESELDAYRSRGHDYLSRLATRIHNSAPLSDRVAYFERNTYRGANGTSVRDAVAGAIANHI